MIRVTLVLLSLSVGAVAQRFDLPLAIVTEATGASLVLTPNKETQVRATRGMLLFSGDRVRANGDTVLLAFCPSMSTWKLSGKGEAVIDERAVRASTGPLTPGPPPSFCELPPRPRLPEPAGGSFGQAADQQATGPVQQTTPSVRAALSAKVPEAQAFVAAHPEDFLARVALATRLEWSGREKEAIAVYQEIRTRFTTTLTRGFEHEEPKATTKQNSGAYETYALLVGISKYRAKGKVPDLQFSRQDAELFRDFLKSDRGGALKPDEQLLLLTDEGATRAAMDQKIRELSARARRSPRKTQLILFVAGHGGDAATVATKDGKVLRREPYILTHETDPSDPKTTGFPMQAFTRMIAAEAGIFDRVLVFVDVCHANQIGPIVSGKQFEPKVRESFTGRNGELAGLLATQKDAFESSLIGGGHGVFTFYVVEGWNGSAPTNSNELGFSNLRNYVQERVGWATRDAQTPQALDPPGRLVLLDDLKKQGITMRAPTMPLPADVIKQARRDAGTKLGAVMDPAVLPTGEARSFEEALRTGLLLPEDGVGGGATGILNSLRLNASTPADVIEQMEGALRVALEDKGQETILRYLNGDQIPQEQVDFQRCARHFEEALRLAPDAVFDESRMLFCQGRARIFDHAYDDARALLEKSIGLDAARSYAYNALGIAYLEQIAMTQGATFEPAIAAFHDAIKYAPFWAYPRHNLALAYSERGDYTNAQREYAKAMEIAEHYSYLPYNLGLLNQKLHDYREASRDFAKALEIANNNEALRRPPGDAPWKERAVIYNAVGALEATQEHWGKAETAYRDALKDDPKYVEARHNLALLLSRMNASQEAVDLWTANLVQDPKDLPTLVGYAAYLAREHQFTTAEQMYRRILTLRQNYPGGRRKLAEILVAQKQIPEAVLELRKALAGVPDSFELAEQIGDLENTLGNTAAAQTDWSDALLHTNDRLVRARLKKKINPR